MTEPSRPPLRFEDVTYERFGIEPERFYARRFAHGYGQHDFLAETAGRYDLECEKFRLLVADLRRLLPAGGDVLDVGCGAGTYAATLRGNVPGIRLTGIDMSEACLAQARRNGYLRTERFDLNRPLPFPDHSFDAVISMDVLGHIEFRHKDLLIAEMARVTRPTGGGHHGAETGFIDYLGARAENPDDPIRKYVHIDGHIGTEPVRDLCARFARHFATVEPRPTFLYPFLHKSAIGELFEPDFKALLDECDDLGAVRAINALLGRLNRHFLDLYAGSFGPAFAAHDTPAGEPPPEHAAARAGLAAAIARHAERWGHDFVALPPALFRTAGFSSILLARERAVLAPPAARPPAAAAHVPGIGTREFLMRGRNNLRSLLRRWRWRLGGGKVGSHAR